MKIGGYFNVWIDEEERKATGIVRVDRMINNTLVDGPVLTGVGIIANWREIPNGKKGLGYRAPKTTVTVWKEAVITRLKKKIEAVENF